MPLVQADRISFSLQIVQAAPKIAGLLNAQTQLNSAASQLQSLDQANANLFAPTNALINGYHAEIQSLDGNGRSAITEQNILDSGNKKLGNFFFPNDTTTVVPSLSSVNNVWAYIKPFALTYAIGKNNIEAHPHVANEPDIIASMNATLISLGTHPDIECSSGQIAFTQPTITPNDAVIALKNDLVTSANALITFLNTELSNIPTNDPNPTNNTQNTTAKTNISGTLLPALNSWLANPDFNPVPGSVTFDQFYTYNSNLLAPTKLHSTQLALLQNALNARSSFITTRITQIVPILGSIAQSLSTGELTSSSGLYGKRYGLLLLRLNALGGSLIQLLGLQGASGAQTSVMASIKDSTSTYSSVLPTTLLKANANGSDTINVMDSSFLSVGDTVYIFAEGQQELQRAVKSINNGLVVLNDVVPSKYSTGSSARLYKDVT